MSWLSLFRRGLGARVLQPIHCVVKLHNAATPSLAPHALTTSLSLRELLASDSSFSQGQSAKHPSLFAILGSFAVGCLLCQSATAWCAPDVPDVTMTEAGSEYVIPDAIRKKYGRYLPWCRLNVDQVPLPFIVNDMDQTYAEVGSTRVVINQLGPSLSKRQATGQLCFRPCVPPRSGCVGSEAQQLYDKYLQQQPAPCIIFRGKGNITEAERDAYPTGLAVLWQDKAWVDRPLALEWAEDVIKPFIEAERAAGIARDDARYLLFQDNLDAQKQPDYINYLKVHACMCVMHVCDDDDHVYTYLVCCCSGTGCG